MIAFTKAIITSGDSTVRHIQNIILVILALFSYSPTLAQGDGTSLYISNNQKSITPKQAYQRLIGTAQRQLTKETQTILSSFHITPSNLTPTLGHYMGSNQLLSVDNALAIHVNPKSKGRKKRAQHFKQESCALFIPKAKGNYVDVKISFGNKDIFYNNLLSQFAALHKNGIEGLSIYFKKLKKNIHLAKISEIEIICPKKKAQAVEQVFSQNTIKEKVGTGLLVYQNGRYKNIL